MKIIKVCRKCKNVESKKLIRRLKNNVYYCKHEYVKVYRKLQEGEKV